MTPLVRAEPRGPRREKIRYTRLRSECIVETADRLRRRIVERFPDSGLGQVAGELLRVATDSAETADRLARPYWPIRAAIAIALAVLAVAVTGMFTSLDARFETYGTVWEILQGIEAGINDLVLIGAGVFFLVTWERRMKRRRALGALHQLRSLAHVIDMHQLTKDPERSVALTGATESSPARTLTPFELVRYLDYCSEMLAIVGKIAALWAECIDEAVALSAVNEIEALTSGLSGKIWHKIVMAQGLEAQEPVPVTPPRASGAGA